MVQLSDKDKALSDYRKRLRESRELEAKLKNRSNCFDNYID